MMRRINEGIEAGMAGRGVREASGSKRQATKTQAQAVPVRGSSGIGNREKVNTNVSGARVNSSHRGARITNPAASGIRGTSGKGTSSVTKPVASRPSNRMPPRQQTEEVKSNQIGGISIMG